MQCKASGSVSPSLPGGKATWGGVTHTMSGFCLGQSWLDFSKTNPGREEMVLQCGQSGVHCLPGCFSFNRVDITPKHQWEISLCRAYSTVLSLRTEKIQSFVSERDSPA